MNQVAPQVTWKLRDLRSGDVEGVCSLDAEHTGIEKPRYWRRVFADFLQADTLGDDPLRDDPLRDDRVQGTVGLAADDDGALVGYLLGEVRAFEFGAEPCGWIFAVGVAPTHTRSGLASRMLEVAVERFAVKGLSVVRTMVKKSDIPVLSFFRSNGFIGGSYHQLELPLAKAHGDDP